MSSSAQHFSLRWNDYLRHVTRAFDTLRSQDCLVDVTLSCEGKQLRAHKMLLSACSTYFRDLFKENPCQHPIIILKNVKFEDLEALVEFMYQGEVNVVQDQLTSFLTTAELLAVQGLTDGTAKDVEHPSEEITLEPPRPSKPKIKPSIENRTPSPTSSRSSKKRRRTQNSEESTSKKSLSEDSDEVTFVPLVMPSLKVEVPDYVDTNIHLEQSAEHTSEIDEPADNSCDYDDSNTKTESMDMSNIVYEEQADDFTGTEMSHILDNPGTSDNQQDSTLQASKKSRTRKSTTFLQKWHIIQEVERNPSETQLDIAKRLGLPATTLSRIIQKKDYILQQIRIDEYGMGMCSHRKRARKCNLDKY